MKAFGEKTNLGHVSVKKTVDPSVLLSQHGRGPTSVAEVLKTDIHLAISSRQSTTSMNLDSIILRLSLAVC